MEVPQTIKQEKKDYFTIEPGLNFETDLMEIKLEPVKLEPHLNVLEPNNLDQKCDLIKKAKIIGNNSKCMFNCSLNEISNQKGSEIKLERSEEMGKIDAKLTIENKELNIKDELISEDKEQGNALTLISRQQRKTRATSNSKKKFSGNNFRCKQIECRTTQQRYLNSHLEQLTPKKTDKVDLYKNEFQVDIYKCERCNYQTICKENFKNHCLKHTNPDGVDMYKCDQCDYQTVRKCHLTQHSLKHKNFDEAIIYKCDQCDYQTVHKQNLKQHCLKHTNPYEVDMYKCDQCDYQTVRKCNLKQHSLKHKNSDEAIMYKCDQCEFLTVNKHILKRHSRKHTNPGEVDMYRVAK